MVLEGKATIGAATGHRGSTSQSRFLTRRRRRFCRRTSRSPGLGIVGGYGLIGAVYSYRGDGQDDARLPHLLPGPVLYKGDEGGVVPTALPLRHQDPEHLAHHRCHPQSITEVTKTVRSQPRGSQKK
jgi:hypothetical protein